MNIKKPLLWYRHITRGVYYTTALNMKSRRTGKPDTVTAFLYTGFFYCGGHFIVIYGFLRFYFPLEHIVYFLKEFVLIETYKGPIDLLMILILMFSHLLTWFCCCYKVTFEEIATEFNHTKPSNWFRFFATFTVPVLGFIAGMYAVNQERKRLGVYEFPPPKEVIASTALKTVPVYLERQTSGT